jgi:hypothetical protein
VAKRYNPAGQALVEHNVCGVEIAVAPTGMGEAGSVA